MKYIIFETEDDPIGLLFRTDHAHRMVADALSRELLKDYTLFSRNAGFIRRTGGGYRTYGRSVTMVLDSSPICDDEMQTMMAEGITILILPVRATPVLVIGPWRLGEALKKLPTRRNFSWGQARTTDDPNTHESHLGKQIKPCDFVMHNNVGKFALTDRHKAEVEAILNCWDC